MIFRLGFRNLLRNRRRTLLSVLATGAGLASLIICDAFILGWETNMIETVTGTWLGHAQIHAPGFRESTETSLTLKGWSDKEKRLTAFSGVRAAAPRVMALGMVSSAADVSNMMVVGIRPDKEERVSRICRGLTEGRLPTHKNEILIGERAGRSLQAEVGDKLVVTAAQAHSGELSQALFRICGTFRLGTPEMDKGMAFIALPAAQELLGLEKGEVHEVAIRFHTLTDADRVASAFEREFSDDQSEALLWRQLTPEITAILEMNTYGMVILSAILFFIVVFGIMNTLFMSLYERTHELGVLRALGTRSGVLGRILLAEALGLSC
ncbi:MAG: ABC transporter permease, partial [Planctomycetota bacterium]